MFTNAKDLNNISIEHITNLSSLDVFTTSSLSRSISIPYPNTKQFRYYLLNLYSTMTPSLNPLITIFEVDDHKISFRELHSELVFHNY